MHTIFQLYSYHSAVFTHCAVSRPPTGTQTQSQKNKSRTDGRLFCCIYTGPMVQQPIQNSTCRLFVFSPVLCQTSRPRLKRPDNRCGNYFAFLCARVPALHTAVPVRPIFSRKYVSTKMMWPMANNVVLLSHVSWFGLF